MGFWGFMRLEGANADDGRFRGASAADRGLDAAAFHICGITRVDVGYIMETFPIVKRKDLAAHGEYRTKRLVLGAFDRLGEVDCVGPAS